MKNLLPFLLLIIFSSCTEKEEILNAESSESYLGNWVSVGNEENVQIFKRTSKLQENEYAFTIKADGSFIENKNNSFCGTPPVMYNIYKGKWAATSGNTLNIETPYWGGTSKYKMEIVFISADTLKVVNIYPENIQE